VLVGSYPTISPLPPNNVRWRYTFCCTFRRLALRKGFAAFPLGSALLYGVRTFLIAKKRRDCLLSLSNNNIFKIDDKGSCLLAAGSKLLFSNELYDYFDYCYKLIIK
jgi:hypothetical protein